MTDITDLATAKKIHALLLDAHPQRDNPQRVAALKLGLAQGGMHTSAIQRSQTIAAMEALDRAVHNRADASEAEQLLLRATRAALQWVRSGS